MTKRHSIPFFFHMMRQKQKELSELFAFDAFGNRTDPDTGDGGRENVRMSETRIYVGLNDAETKEQKFRTETSLEMLKNICRKYKVAFSVDVEEGGYFHASGEYVEETSLVLIMMDAGKDTVRNIANDLCRLFHQESVLITEDYVDGFFLYGQGDQK